MPANITCPICGFTTPDKSSAWSGRMPGVANAWSAACTAKDGAKSPLGCKNFSAARVMAQAMGGLVVAAPSLEPSA